MNPRVLAVAQKQSPFEDFCRLLVSSGDGTWTDFSPAPTALPNSTQYHVGLWANRRGREICLVVAGSGQNIRFSHFDGTSWTDRTVSSPGGLPNNLVGLAPDDLWAPVPGSSSPNGSVWHFDGATWTQLGSSLWTGTTPYSAWASPSGLLWVGTWGGTWKVKIRQLDETWTDVTASVSALNGCYAIAGTSDSDVWLAGDDLYHYNGSTFTRQNLNGTFRALCNFDSRYYAGADATTRKGWRYDGSWQSVNLDSNNVNFFCAGALTEIDAYLGGAWSGGGKLYHTVDGGLNWTAEQAGYNWKGFAAIDVVAPSVTLRDPEPGARGVDPSRAITVEIDQIQAADLRIAINGVSIYDGSAFTSDWSASSLALQGYGVRATLVPRLPLSTRIVRIALSSADGQLDHNYAFVTAAPPISRGEAHAIDADGDLILSPEGQLLRDPTIAARCSARLLTQRARWAIDPDFGSRLTQLGITKDWLGRARVAVLEGLQPLVNEGAIRRLDVQPSSRLNNPNRIAMDLTIETAAQGQLRLHSVPVGR